MSRRIVPATTDEILGAHHERIQALELKREQEIADTSHTLREVSTVFTLSGLVYASTSPRFYHSEGAKLARVLCALGTAGSSSTEIRMKRNGANVGSLITLASSENTVEESFSGVSLAADSDYLTVQVVTAGTSAEDLTVLVRFS